MDVMVKPDRSAHDLFDDLAELFLTAHRRGEKPDIDEFIARAPDLAERIRRLFPTLLAFEEVASVVAPASGQVSTGAPEQLGEYRIVREIGRGGMGVVYEAVQVSLGRHVALKVLPAGPRSEGIHLERFQREARIAAKLHHGNIVPVFGVGADRGMYFYAMQFIPGHGLDVVLEDVRRLRGRTIAVTGDPTAGSSAALAGEPVDRYYRHIASLGADAADALAYAHGHGVIHRDIKPSNLLLDVHGHLWITDFGLAKADDTADLTNTGDVVGTLRYLAPERFDGQADAGGDVYALGVTLYELLALEPAFPGTDRPKLIDRIVRGDPVPPRRHDPGIPRDLETIVLKAMAHRPADRYSDVSELAADLRRFVDGRPVAARPPGNLELLGKWVRRHPAAAALLGVVFAATVTVTGVIAVYAGRLSDALAESTKNLTDAQAENRRANNNLKILREAIDNYTLILEKDKRLKSVDLNDLKQKLFATAVQFYEVVADQLGDDREAADARFQIAKKLAVLHTILNDFNAALADYALAVRLGAELTDRYPDALDYRVALGQVFQNRGLLNDRMDHRGEAVRDYEQAVAFQREVLRIAPDHRGARNQLANHLIAFGNHQRQDGRLKDAGTLFSECRTLVDRLAAEAPSGPQVVQTRMKAYLVMAMLFRETQRYADTETMLREAVSNGEWLAVEHPGDAEDTHYFHLARVKLGEVLYLLGRLDEADIELHDALKIGVLLSDEFRSTPSYAIAVSDNYSTLGHSQLGRNRPAEALQWYEKAISAFPSDSPSFAPGRSMLGTIYLNRADVLIRLRRQEEALDSLDKAVAQWKPLCERTAHASTLKQSLSHAQEQRAQIFRNLNRWAESAAAWEQADEANHDRLRTYRLRLSRAGDLTRIGQVDAAVAIAGTIRVAKDATADNFVDCAWVYSLAAAAEKADVARHEEYAARAVEQLRQGFAKGYTNLPLVECDAVFAPLRGRDDYKALIEEERFKLAPPDKSRDK